MDTLDSRGVNPNVSELASEQCEHQENWRTIERNVAVDDQPHVSELRTRDWYDWSFDGSCTRVHID